MSRLVGGAALALALAAPIAAQDTCSPNVPNGSPQPQTVLSQKAGVPVVVDVDRDGHLDLLQVSDSLDVLYGDGSGTFPTTVSYVVDAGASFVLSGDVDGDGDLDLLVGGRAIELFVSDGRRGFGLVEVAPPLVGERYLRSSSFADLDGDGDLDVLDRVTLGRLAVHWNDGADGFRQGAELATQVGYVVAGDIDGDGRDEVFLSTGDGSVERVDFEWTDDALTSHTTLLAIGPAWLRLVVVDADDDGDLDLTDGWGHIFVNDGGTLVAPTSLAAQGESTVVGHLDHDDVLDTVWWSSALLFRSLSTRSGGEILLDLNYGAPPPTPTILGVAVGDLNEDGADELIVSLTGFYFLQGSTFAYVGWAEPPPTVTSASPTTLRVPGEHEIVVEGADFQPGVWCVRGSSGPLTVLSATPESATRMVVRVRVDAGAGSETAFVAARGPDGREVGFSVRVRSRHLARARGRLVDTDAAAADSLRLAGRYRSNELAGSQRLVPRAQGMTLRVGHPDRPLVLHLPSEDWRTHERRRRHVYRSPSSDGPRVRVEIDERRNTFRLRVAKSDLETGDDGRLLVELASGEEALTEVLETRERVRRSTPGRRVLRVR